MPTPRLRARRWHTAALVVGLAAIVLAVHVQQARAVILPATTIDGPSEDIVGFGGVAMAEDGSGGLVYLKRVDGVPTCSSRATPAGNGSRRSRSTPGSPTPRAGRGSARLTGAS